MISSTVGLEALLHGKPVLTLGQPFYSGYGVTVDVDSFRELQAKVGELLRLPARPRAHSALPARRHALVLPGSPVAIDPSDANARRMAASLDVAARGDGAARGPGRSAAPVSAQA